MFRQGLLPMFQLSEYFKVVFDLKYRPEKIVVNRSKISDSTSMMVDEQIIVQYSSTENRGRYDNMFSYIMKESKYIFYDVWLRIKGIM